MNDFYLSLLNQGYEDWNCWREQNPDQVIDLSGCELSFRDLEKFNFSRTNLSYADLTGANLLNALLEYALLIEAKLHKTILPKNNLVGAALNRVNLSSYDLSNATLRGAQLVQAILNKATLTNADLTDSILIEVSAVDTNFYGSNLTGACIENWRISRDTILDNVICDYVYLKADKQERRPHIGIFKPGEFAALLQQALNTIDLIFKDGIDWQAFFQSFQDLRSQYADQDLSIQAIEKKRGGAFIVRVEVAESADKSTIESSAKELYETKLTLLEQRYRAELQTKEGEIVAYREQSANLMKITEMLAVRPPISEGNQYDMRGAQFGGGYVAGNVEGNQYGGIINNYGPNTEDITRLLTALRDQAQTFPTDQKDEANDALDDLERDLKEEQPDQDRIGRRLKKLATLALAITSGAVAFSGDLNTFSNNVEQLAENLNIPIEQIQPNQLPSSGTP